MSTLETNFFFFFSFEMGQGKCRWCFFPSWGSQQEDRYYYRELQEAFKLAKYQVRKARPLPMLDLRTDISYQVHSTDDSSSPFSNFTPPQP